MELGLIIKKARLSKKITQEELAIALGVTTQAVSRWETGVSYPDIALIPSIANYLEVSTDELFGIDLNQRKQKVNKILEEDDEYTKKYALDQSLKILRRGLKEFPNNEYILQRITRNYHNQSCLLKDKNREEEREMLNELIINNCLKTLEVAKDIEIIYRAKDFLISAYSRNEDYKYKALEMVNEFPSIFQGKEMLLLNVLGEGKKHEQIKKNIISLMKLFTKVAGHRIMEFLENDEQRIEMFEKNIQMIKLFIGENLCWFNGPCSNFALSIAEIYAKNKDINNTLYYLNESLQYAKNYVELQESYEYDSFWLKGIKGKKDIVLFSGNIKSIENDLFDFIKDNENYKQILKEYKEIKDKEDTKLILN